MVDLQSTLNSNAIAKKRESEEHSMIKNLSTRALASPSRTRVAGRQPVHERLYNLASNKKRSDAMDNGSARGNAPYRSSTRSKSSFESRKESSTAERLYNLAKKKRIIEEERQKKRKKELEEKVKPKAMNLATRSYTPVRDRPGTIHTRLYNIARVKKIRR